MAEYASEAACRAQSANFLTKTPAAGEVTEKAAEAVKAASKGVTVEKNAASATLKAEELELQLSGSNPSDVGMGGLQEYGQVHQAVAAGATENATTLANPIEKLGNQVNRALKGGTQPTAPKPPQSPRKDGFASARSDGECNRECFTN